MRTTVNIPVPNEPGAIGDAVDVTGLPAEVQTMQLVADAASEVALEASMDGGEFTEIGRFTGSARGRYETLEPSACAMLRSRRLSGSTPAQLTLCAAGPADGPPGPPGPPTLGSYAPTGVPHVTTTDETPTLLWEYEPGADGSYHMFALVHGDKSDGTSYIVQVQLGAKIVGGVATILSGPTGTVEEWRQEDQIAWPSVGVDVSGGKLQIFGTGLPATEFTWTVYPMLGVGAFR